MRMIAGADMAAGSSIGVRAEFRPDAVVVYPWPATHDCSDRVVGVAWGTYRRGEPVVVSIAGCLFNSATALPFVPRDEAPSSPADAPAGSWRDRPPLF